MAGVKALAYWLYLRWVIKFDYALRKRGRRPDRWHWADEMACSWGYFTPA